MVESELVGVETAGTVTVCKARLVTTGAASVPVSSVKLRGDQLVYRSPSTASTRWMRAATVTAPSARLAGAKLNGWALLAGTEPSSVPSPLTWNCTVMFDGAAVVPEGT